MKIIGICLLILLLSPIFIIESHSQNENADVIIGKDSVTSNYDYHATGFNPQEQITKENIDQLEVKWIFPWPESEGVEGLKPRIGSISQVIVVNGIVYGRTEDLTIYAIDANNGELLWEYQPPSRILDLAKAQEELPISINWEPSLSSHAHSFSYFEGKIYAPWPNCQVYGLNAETGKLEFRLRTTTCENLEGNVGYLKGLQSVGPVFDGKNRVLIYGTGGREAVEGGRGSFRGYDLDTGNLLWTFYLMPPQDTGDPEWSTRVADKGWIQGIKASAIDQEILLNDWGECPEECGFGKGDIGIGWGQWAVDEETGIAYLGTGNPSPSWNATYRPGPNIFGSSVIALQTQTGELVWWHQVIANDLGDLDCSWNTALTKINDRKVIVKECKGAQLYVFDAADGEAIWSTDYSPHVKRGMIGPHRNYEELLDPTNMSDMKKPWVSYPTNKPNWRKQGGGSESDVAIAYGKIYSTTFHWWFMQKITAVEPIMKESYGRITMMSEVILPSNATVWAHNLETGKVMWKYDIDDVGIRGGVTVSGGMIWFSTTDGTLRALDAESGELIWERYHSSPSPIPPAFGADSEGNILVFTIIGAGGVIGREAPVPGALIAYGLSEKKVEQEVIIKEVVKEVEIINEQETYPEREEYDSDTTEGNNSTQTFIAGIIIGSGMLFIIQRFQRNKTKTI
ncbi:MAG: PQQ-binding-like beta-propeller repeat protein [Thermoproteota archaeon]